MKVQKKFLFEKEEQIERWKENKIEDGWDWFTV